MDIPLYHTTANSSKTKIKGTIKHANKADVQLHILYDGISLKEETIVLKLDASNRFDMTLELNYPVYAYVQNGSQISEFYISPGDDIDLLIDVSKLENSSVQGGTRRMLHDQLRAQKQFLKTFSEQLALSDRAKDFMAFAKLMEDFRKKSQSRLEKFNKRHVFSNDDYNFAKGNIEYSVAVELFNFIDRHEIKLNNRYSFLKKMNPTAYGMLNNMNYLNFLDSYFSFLMSLPEHAMSSKFDLADQYLEGEARTYLKAKELAIKCKLGFSYEFAPKIKSFIAESEDPQANQALSIIYNETKELNAGALAPSFSLADINGNAVELNDYKGKVVFIDFWATWCRPCLKALHYSQEMKEFYKDEKVVFLYVSMDEDPEMWASYIQANQLEGVHVNVKNTLGISSDIAKLYKIRKIPAFVLIDQEGKIAFPKAASPGSNLLYTQINGLLKNPRF